MVGASEVKIDNKLRPKVHNTQIMKSSTTQSQTSQSQTKQSQTNQSQTNQSQSLDSPTRSFAEVMNNPTLVPEEHFTEECGIIISAIQGTKMKEYALAIGALIGAQHVKGAMRIQGNRIALYVSTPELVDKLCDPDTCLLIGDNKLFITPEKAKTRKTIFTNVSLKIPNTAIEQSLSYLGIELASGVSRINLYIDVDGYAVASARRQVMIMEEDILKLPETIKVLHLNQHYMISAIVENQGCYKCHSPGHFIKNCPERVVSHQRINASQRIETARAAPPARPASLPLTDTSEIDKNQNSSDDSSRCYQM